MDEKSVTGNYVEIHGEQFYQISNYDVMQPFFMSLVSDSDHWMFISSNGGLTAGRKNPDNALFPYYTDDRIHDAQDQTGSKTIVLLSNQDQTCLWEPFSNRYQGVYSLQRNLFKNIPGNKLIFEEVNTDLGLTFRTAWMNSERFGFVKRSTLLNHNDQTVQINIVDGIQNILPFGINRRFQLEYSTLADGYKKNELDSETGLGIFRMSSIPTDKAEPSEALKVTMVWAAGLDSPLHLLSSNQLDAFRHCESLTEETDEHGARGAYFINTQFVLGASDEKFWHIAADVSQDRSAVADRILMLKTGITPAQQIEEDVNHGTEKLVRIVANSDGLQTSADALSANRHFANVLFNEMRGGIFDQDYQIERSDFIQFVQTANKPAAEIHRSFLESLPEIIDHADLIHQVKALDDPILEKLCYEYLPLTFGRRHGDPSRPWNIFSIDIKDAQGEKILNYQGNWRDIFQNWEALGYSFPGYIESMIFKFLNATTADGYNPYRVMRDGFEWEVLDPDDAWSYIGYWGDHQIVYLLKLLEVSSKFHPETLQTFLCHDIFAYANVPYRIKPYSDLLKDSQNTIDFDVELDTEIQERVKQIGMDGKFIHDPQGRMIQINMTEKMLVTVLAKLSNFIPEAGIWMNTQRPEWNDANNALVGSGVSMVTLYYLRRFMAFMKSLFETFTETDIPISSEVANHFNHTVQVFIQFAGLLEAPISDKNRKSILDALGQAGSDYRKTIYQKGFTGEHQSISVSSISAFCDWAFQYIDHSVKANRCEDGLYHAYNLMQVDGGNIKIRHLYEMLEGQVAVLSAGSLSTVESLEVLDALRQSALYREDQNSYILYPDRELPKFLEKNNIPQEAIESSNLLKKLLADGDQQIVSQDANGQAHFNGDFRNVRLLEEQLDKLAAGSYGELIQNEKSSILQIYEDLFDHQSFTGRSGTFYKYEGLGSIYWHMVSKLLLAVQEVLIHAINEHADVTVIQRLKAHYTEIREGIGVHKSPELYGAFPTDPYSHTPGFVGVQQPGMTGQVKEDILTRFGELGIEIREGKISIRKELINRDEFLNSSQSFTYYDVNQQKQSVILDAGSIAFTYCQVLFVYHLSDEEKIQLTLSDGSDQILSDLCLNHNLSEKVYKRTGDIVRLDVSFDF
ncbi:hypothetical protein HQ585_02025 [candidate division KSB1 bacterium]|nr:hypothetical protein [candidate division KSB1 bacterium]